MSDQVGTKKPAAFKATGYYYVINAATRTTRPPYSPLLFSPIPATPVLPLLCGRSPSPPGHHTKYYHPGCQVKNDRILISHEITPLTQSAPRPRRPTDCLLSRGSGIHPHNIQRSKGTPSPLSDGRRGFCYILANNHRQRRIATISLITRGRYADRDVGRRYRFKVAFTDSRGRPTGRPIALFR